MSAIFMLGMFMPGIWACARASVARVSANRSAFTEEFPRIEAASKAAAANIGRPTRHGREAGRRLKPACKLKLTPQKEDQIRRMVGGGAGGDLSTRAGGSELASDRKIVDVSIASEGKDTAMVDVCAMVAGTSSWAHLGACL